MEKFRNRRFVPSFVTLAQEIYRQSLNTVLQLSVTPRLVEQLLSDTQVLCYCLLKKAPYIMDRHYHARIKWDKEYGNWNTFDLSKLIFTEVVNFNFDGPYGLRQYWYDMRKEPL